MTRRLSKLTGAALATIAACLLFSPAANSVVGRVSRPPLGGVNVTDLAFDVPAATVNREIAWAKSLDAHLIRVEIPWSALEPARGQIEPRALAFADHLVNSASTAGIKVVALALSTPCWASSAPPTLLSKCNTGRSGGAQAWPPRDPRSYASFVAFLASRYKS